uniref:Bardet-Biedl syndrome 12 n=1 Tax=Cyprinus carpio TaxID=7962 RepID=A0A8C1X9S4_CYPCA
MNLGKYCRRRHVRLQQAIAATTHGFLGPNKRPKFIQDEDAGEGMPSRSSFTPGREHLVFLAGLWSRVALECLSRGITVLDIKTAMRKVLEVSLEVCKQSALSVEEVSCQKLKDCKPTSALKSEIQNTKMLRHFHFHDAQTENTQTALNDVTHLEQAASHGCDSSMCLVLKACKLQSKNSENAPNRSLDIQKLVKCLIPGECEEKSSVFRGFVVLLSALNIALVSGNLCEKYRHVGFSRPGNVMHITDGANMSGVSLEVRWTEDALRKLHELSIDVVLVSGSAGVKLEERVLGTNILVTEGVKSSVLKDLSTGAVLVSYVTQIDENYVGQGVTVSQQRDFSEVSIVTASMSLVTAVISSSVSAKLQSLDRDGKATGRCGAGADGRSLDGLCIHLDDEQRVAGVYDNVWRRALDLVFLVLQSDTEIITGVSEGENVFRELMYL